MSRYIDVDIALEIIDRYRNTTDENGKIIADAIIDIIKTITPTVDVAEITHGCWIDVPMNVYDDRYRMNKYNKRTKCSVCEYAMPYEYPRYRICPNCGAKMDGERKDEE